MWIQSLGWEDPLKKGMATHSSILAWEIPWTVEPGRPQSPGSQTQTQLTESMHTLGHLYKVRESEEHGLLRLFRVPIQISNLTDRGPSLPQTGPWPCLAYQTYLIGSSANLVVYPRAKSSVFSALPWKGWWTYKIKLQRLSDFYM